MSTYTANTGYKRAAAIAALMVVVAFAASMLVSPAVFGKWTTHVGADTEWPAGGGR